MADKKRIVITITQDVEYGLSVAKAIAGLVTALDDISDVRIENVQVSEVYVGNFAGMAGVDYAALMHPDIYREAAESDIQVKQASE